MGKSGRIMDEIGKCLVIPGNDPGRREDDLPIRIDQGDGFGQGVQISRIGAGTGIQPSGIQSWQE